MKKKKSSIKKTARGFAWFLFFILVSFNLCAQTTANETEGNLLIILIVVAALVILSAAIYGVVHAMKSNAIFYCGISDYIIAIIPLVLLVIGPQIFKWTPVLTILIIGCAIFYNLFMAFSLNSGKSLYQITIFLGRITIGYLSLVLLLFGLLIIIGNLFGGPSKRDGETHREYETRRAGNLAFGAGLTVGGGALIWKLINAKPGDLAIKERNLTKLGKLTVIFLMAGCIGASNFIGNLKTDTVEMANIGSVETKTAQNESASTKSSAASDEMINVPVENGIYPESSGFVNDYAGFIDPVSKIKLIAICKELESEKGVQLFVVAINSLEDYQTGDKTLESFAANLFNKWGIGNKEKNDGILVLVLSKEIRIELGLGYGHEFDNTAASVNNVMLPYLQKGENGEGLIKGVEFIIGHIESVKQNKESNQEMTNNEKSGFADNTPPQPGEIVDGAASEQSKSSNENSQERSSINIEQSQGMTEQPIRISNEQRPEKIKDAVSVYPPVALKFQIQGVVTIEVGTDNNGRVIQARVISGPPLLHNAALTAVKQWIYEPYVLNGEPKSVIFTDSVTFSLKN